MTVTEFLDWTPPPGLEKRRWHLFDERPALAPVLRIEQVVLHSETLWTIAAHLHHAGSDAHVRAMVGVVPAASQRHLYVACIGVTHTPTEPVLLVEIETPENRHLVRIGISMCKQVPSVQEILVLDSTSVCAALHRRKGDGEWDVPLYLFKEGRLHLRAIGIDVPLERLYQNVDLRTEAPGMSTVDAAPPKPRNINVVARVASMDIQYDVPEYLTVEEFFEWPPAGSIKKRWHLLDNKPVLMPPLSHDQAALHHEARSAISECLRENNSEARVGTMVAVHPAAAAGTIYVAALGITHSPAAGSRIMPDPVLLVEIIDPVNFQLVRAGIAACKLVPTVREILVLDGLQVCAALHRRNANGGWDDPETIFDDESVDLRSIGITVPINRLYRGVHLWVLPPGQDRSDDEYWAGQGVPFNVSTPEPRVAFKDDKLTWVLQTAERLRRGLLDDIDRMALVEFLNDYAIARRREVADASLDLLQALLTASAQPQRSPEGICAGRPPAVLRFGVAVQQRKLRELLRTSPGLLPVAPDLFAASYATARKSAATATGQPEDSFPAASPWTLDDALAVRWP